MAALTSILAAGSLALGAVGQVSQVKAAKQAEEDQKKALKGQEAAAESAAKLKATKEAAPAKIALGTPDSKKKKSTVLGGLGASTLGGL